MLKILQRYVLREVLAPTALALCILTFLVMVRTVFSESEDIEGSLSLGLSLQLLASLLPTLLTITIPMSMLIGVLLGIGRLTVDSEIKAFRTHGVNLFPVFLPVVVCGGLASLLVLYNCLYFAPFMMGRSMRLVDALVADRIEHLEPGKFHSLPNIMGSSAILYFKEKDPETGYLKNIYLCLEGGGDLFLEQVDESPKNDRPPAPAPTTPPPSAPAETSSPETVKKTDSIEGENDGKEEKGPGKKQSAVKTDKKAEEAIMKTLFLASRGRIHVDPLKKRAVLVLENGTMHGLDANAGTTPTYTISDFELFTQSIVDYDKARGSQEVNKKEIGWTFSDINQVIASKRLALTKTDPALSEEKELKRKSRLVEDIHYLRAKQYMRISISLACFAFVLIATPLAIYIRPSGKSVGISIAFILLVLYYAFLYFGEHLTRNGMVVLGPTITFLPILLLVGGGAFMMHRVVHR